MELIFKAGEWEAVLIPYEHERYNGRRRFCRFLMNEIGFRTIVKVDKVLGLENFPSEGPGIVMINHIAFVDPMMVLAKMPRLLVPLGKIEAWHYPIIGIFPRIWGAIPVHREGVDRQAIRMAKNVLEAGELILMAPEGTRNPNLQEPREGVAYLGVKTGAPVIPVAVTGTQGFPTIKPSRWMKPGTVIEVGRPFIFRPPSERLTREVLKQMMDETMYVLASMLPEDLRGVYSDLSNASTDMIEFVDLKARTT
ncbi:MAG: hypothetical protein GTO18_02335 [Anaerolineales bacterium]|nr:hypothetical protein [Anaerolineales bacterium]